MERCLSAILDLILISVVLPQRNTAHNGIWVIYVQGLVCSNDKLTRVYVCTHSFKYEIFSDAHIYATDQLSTSHYSTCNCVRPWLFAGRAWCTSILLHKIFYLIQGRHPKSHGQKLSNNVITGRKIPPVIVNIIKFKLTESVLISCYSGSKCYFSQNPWPAALIVATLNLRLFVGTQCIACYFFVAILQVIALVNI